MTYQFYYNLSLKHGLDLKADTEAATTDQILPLVKYELGLAFLPEPMAREAIKNREIVQIHVQEEVPKRDICMVYDSKKPMSVAAQKLRRLLVDGTTPAVQ